MKTLSQKKARDPVIWNRIISLTLAACIGLPIAGYADSDEAKFATEQLQKGTILALKEILNRVHHITGDAIVEVGLEHAEDTLVYEVYFLDEKGRRREIYVNAATGQVLMQKIDDRSDARSAD